MAAKEGKYFPRITKVIIGNKIGIVHGLSLFTFNPFIVSELWVILSPLTYQVRYALYSSWRGVRLDKAALWDHTTGVHRGYKRKPPPLIKSWFGTIIRDQ